MFDINLLGTPGIQPEKVEASHSYIQPVIKPPPIMIVEDEEESGGMSRRSRILISVAIVVSAVLLAAIIYLMVPKPDLDVHARDLGLNLPAAEEVSRVVRVIEMLPESISVKRLLISPELMIVNLFSEEQIELNLLGVSLEESLELRCRISGNKADGARLSMSVPIEYVTQTVHDTGQFITALAAAGVLDVQDHGFKILARIDKEQIGPIMRKVVLPDLMYFKRATVENVNGTLTLEIILDTLDNK